MNNIIGLKTCHVAIIVLCYTKAMTEMVFLQDGRISGKSHNFQSTYSEVPCELRPTERLVITATFYLPAETDIADHRTTETPTDWSMQWCNGWMLRRLRFKIRPFGTAIRLGYGGRIQYSLTMNVQHTFSEKCPAGRLVFGRCSGSVTYGRWYGAQNIWT